MSRKILGCGLLVSGLAFAGCSSSSESGIPRDGSIAGADLAGQTFCDPNRAVETFYDMVLPTGYKGGWAARFHNIYRGNTRTTVDYGDAGLDDLWMTDDDRIRSYLREEIVGTVRIMRDFYDPGPDKIWFTEDDLESTTPSDTWCESLDLEGRMKTRLTPADWGPDRKPCTADDVYGHALVLSNPVDPGDRYPHYPDGTQYVYYRDPGPDKTWLTADDVIEGKARFTRAADGSSGSMYRTDSPGPDGRWGTSDDPERLYSTYTSTDPDRADQKVFYSDGRYGMGYHYFCKPPAPF